MARGFEVDVKIEGLKELDDALAKLPDEVQLRVLRGAMRRAATIIRDAAAARAPRDTGQLAGDIQVVTRLNPDGVAASIGPSRDSFYGSFHELGTATVPARPFLRPALDESGPRALAQFSTELWKGIERAVKRLARLARRSD